MSTAKALETIRSNQSLKGISLQVYEIISQKPGLTGGEISQEYFDIYNDPGRGRNELAKRISDLVSWGAVKPYGKTLCPFTGRMANRYVVTGSLPERTQKVKTVSEVPTSSSSLLTTASLDTILWAINFFNKVSSKWYLPHSFRLKAFSLSSALNEVLDRNGKV